MDAESRCWYRMFQPGDASNDIHQKVFSHLVERPSPIPLFGEKRIQMKLRESYRAAKELPAQIRQTVNLAISALFIALIALCLSVVRNAN